MSGINEFCSGSLIYSFVWQSSGQSYSGNHLVKATLAIIWSKLLWQSSGQGYSGNHLVKATLAIIWSRLFWQSSGQGYKQARKLADQLPRSTDASEPMLIQPFA